MADTTRDVAHELITITFGIAHAFRLNPHHFQGMSKDEVNEFVCQQLKDKGYHVYLGVAPVLLPDSPKP